MGEGLGGGGGYIDIQGGSEQQYAALCGQEYMNFIFLSQRMSY